MSVCTWQKCVEWWCHSPPLLCVITTCLSFCLPFYQVKHQTSLFCFLGVTPDASYLWMSDMGDGIIKSAHTEQAQLHGARMQTFIIEQQAFIIHTSGFPRSPKINYEPPLHTLRSLMLRHRRRWIFSRAPSLLTGAADSLLIYSVKKKRLTVVTNCIVGCVPFTR